MTPTYYDSSNWSGYVVTGGPYTAVSGTFTVPALSSGATSGDNTSTWVGIDGWGNNNLIQAGIDEDIDPDNPGQVDIWPWWEVLPAESTPISTVSVSAGDTVTVSISQQGGDEWEISLTDDTNGQHFSIDQPYSGAGQSAEWVVEAPENAGTGQIYPLAPYSPAVSFTDLGINGNEQGLDEVSLVQGGTAVSTPSAFTSSGFTVSYSGLENGPEVPSGHQLAEFHGQGGTGALFEG